MNSESKALIAAAGSGKTTRLINDALVKPSRRVLVTTYTRENLAEIQKRLLRSGMDFGNVSTSTWYEFLLRDCIKPFQAYMTSEIGKIRSVNFPVIRQRTPWLSRVPKRNFDKYYLDANNDVYHDVASELGCLIDSKSGGKIVSRLSQCFDSIFIDELQDLSGYDLDLIECFIAGGIHVQLVGDPRQAIYSTNTSPRNRQYRRNNIISWTEKLNKAGIIEIEELNTSYRNNQDICDYANQLFPNFPATVAAHDIADPHRGVHLVDPSHLVKYREVFAPQELRWSKASKNVGPNTLNFGEVKGTEFDRVLIHATKPMTDYISKQTELKPEPLAKFYVAVTRARHSVAIVPSSRIDNPNIPYWSSD